MITDKETLKRFLPFVGTALIILGFIKFKIFYNRFNIDIENYLELTEVLVLFLTDVVYYGIMILSVFFYNFLVTSESEDTEKEKIKQAIEEESSFKKRLTYHYKLSANHILMVIIATICLVLVYFFNYARFWNALFSTITIPVVLLYVILVMEYRHKYKKVYGINLNPSINNLALLIFMFSLYSVSSAFSEIQKIYKKPDKVISFRYMNDVIKSSSNIKYLGETSNYVFMYDHKKQESKVFEKSEIRCFKIKYTGE